ncbi:hypothetical protein BpHYR1_039559 [Brachionus plicatilis]|uniref:Uncharacterized protein n=1 Tax=Brachionus plicatilis TaxID=10195 RepID=A0A3M7QFS4_BRAPC|nr:hypothetical protein BpHYR1_039559 [Brachionus plicatilis]
MPPGYTPSIRIRLTQPLTLLKSKQYADYFKLKFKLQTAIFQIFFSIFGRLNKMKMSKNFTLPVSLLISKFFFKCWNNLFFNEHFEHHIIMEYSGFSYLIPSLSTRSFDITDVVDPVSRIPVTLLLSTLAGTSNSFTCFAPKELLCSYLNI